MIGAKVIADSVSESGKRLTTLQVSFHRYVLSEFNTHRVFSRNFRSSRAVPTKKLLEEVKTSPAMPVHWGKNQPGMQADEEHNDPVFLKGHPDGKLSREAAWKFAASVAASFSEAFYEAGYHKQVVNRIIEPFLFVHGVVSATEYDNFFGLRLHSDAQPEIRALAEAMWKARSESEPKLLNPGEWHLPYADTPEDREEAERYCYQSLGRVLEEDVLDALLRTSTARCARVSYKVFDSDRKSSLEDDVALYNKLVVQQPVHASPTEHQATPDTESTGGWSNPSLHGNFVGWKQHRKTIAGESLAPLPEGYDYVIDEVL